jgi:hypothetical protein
MADSIDLQQLKETKRQDFLFKMYDQLFADIDQHILVVWQSVGVLFGGVAIFALVEKQVITLDFACAIFVVLAGWSIAHSIQAGYWYNRNLAIIANIERQFLRPTDLREVHYYFGAHRPKNKLLDQLWLQIILATLITAIFLCLHFVTRVQPGLNAPLSHFEWQRALPYMVLIIVALLLKWETRRANRKYAEFIRNSPGLQVDTTQIEYGIGHGGRQQGMNVPSAQVKSPESPAPKDKTS